MQDPESYLQNEGIDLPCAVEPWKHAILDAAHRALVNHEVYFFSNDRARARFLEDPLPWCGLLTDPVSGQRFKPSGKSPKLVYEDRPYYFTSKKNLARFKADPEKYKNPVRKMPKKM